MNNREIIEKVLFPNGENYRSKSPFLQKASAFKSGHLERAVQKLVPGTKVSEIIAMDKYDKGKRGVIFTEKGFFDSDFNFLVGKKNHVALIPYADIRKITIHDPNKREIGIQYKNGNKHVLYSHYYEFLVEKVTEILAALYSKDKPESRVTVDKPEVFATVDKPETDKSAEQIVQKTSEPAASNEDILKKTLETLYQNGRQAYDIGEYDLAFKVFQITAEAGHQASKDMLAQIQKPETDEETPVAEAVQTPESIKKDVPAPVPVPAPAPALDPRSFQRHINVATVGQSGSGKTTLTAAITQVLHQRYGLSKAVTVDQIDCRREEKEQHRSVCASAVEYCTPDTHFAHFDLPGHPNYRKNFITTVSMADIAILVAGIEELNEKEIAQQFNLLKNAGVPGLIVFINMPPEEDPDSMKAELMEMDVMDIVGLTNNIIIVRGSAQAALENPDGKWGDRIITLIESLEKIGRSLEPRRTDLPFCMPIHSVHYVPARGMAVLGCVERGTIKRGEYVELAGLSEEPVDADAVSIQIFGHQTEEAGPGDYIGVLLRGVSSDEVRRGQVLVCPGTAAMSKKFIAEIYFFKKDEGGHNKIINDGFRPQFYLRTADVTGTICFDKNQKYKIIPGDNANLIIELDKPAVLEEGLHFSCRNGRELVGLGVITEILK